MERALESWRTDPAGAYAHLDSARRLNALSDRPDLYAGAIASRRGELERMRLSFERALERNPASWYAELELALVDTRGNRWRAAERRLRGALVLNPHEPVSPTCSLVSNATNACRSRRSTDLRPSRPLTPYVKGM